MVFWGTLKNRLLAGLAASNRIAHRFGLPRAIRGGPIRADHHSQAGGVKSAILLDPKVISFPSKLIYYQEDPNIFSPETRGEIKEVRFGEVELWEYDDARVLPGAHGGLHGVSKDDWVIPGLNHPCLDENFFFETRLRKPPCNGCIEKGLLLDGGPGGNYYHWVIDILPALGLARKALGAGLKIILNPYSKVRERQWDELGIPAESRVIFKGPLKVGKLYTIGGLHNSFYGVFRPEPCLNFWSGFGRPSRSGRKIFISRSDRNKRLLVNERELFNRLERLGFEKLTLSGLKLRDQASLFAEASIVIGMHGAGFSNMIHALPNTKLVEIFPPGYSHCFYQYICFLKDCLYYPIFSEYSQAKQDANTDFNSKPGFLAMDQIDKILSICK